MSLRALDVVLLLSLVALLSTLIPALFVEEARRRRLEKASHESEEKYRQAIQEQNDLRERVRQSEARNLAILQTLPDMMFTLSREGVYLDCHLNDVDDSFVPSEQFIGRNMRDLLPPDLAQAFFRAFEAAVATGKAQRVEYSLPMRGEPRYYEARLVSLGADKILSTVRDITEMHDLAGHLIAAQEVERGRIARELHDDVSQELALLSIRLEENARHGLMAGDVVEPLVDLTAEIASSVHRLAHQLHPSKLEALGLVAALAAYAREVSIQHGIQVDFHHDGVPQSVPFDVSLCIYRIVQEALHNVVKHSGAGQASITLCAVENTLEMQVVDSGIGFIPSEKFRAGLGLVSMRERVHFLGGRIAIDSAPGMGTRVGVVVTLGFSPFVVS